MFREMRRQKAAITTEEAYLVLERCQEGVLGTIGANGYPHTVPVNYVLFQNKIYIHSAKEGYKLDNISQNPRVSFTVYDNIEVIEETFTTAFESTIVYGNATVIPGNQEVLMELIKKYSPSFMKEGKMYVQAQYDTTFLIEITIEHITGKRRTKNK